MSNPKRAMCTMRKIDKITPIEGADRIECLHVGGWTCVDQKKLWHEGDYCVYFEIDTFLPTNDDRYKFLAQYGEKTMNVKGTPTVGHCLRTRRLRNQWSQGLVMKPDVVFPDIPESAYETICERKVRLDGPANVCEYHPDQNSLAAGFIGKYDPFVAPRTGCERVQNIDQETFDLIKRCGYFTSVKVDGTSVTLVNDSRHGRIRAFSHNNEFSLDEGQGRLVMETAKRQGLLKFLEGCQDISIQCELCGPKIGGNTLRLKEYRLFVFSVYDVIGRQYIAPYNLGKIDWDSPELFSRMSRIGEGNGADYLDQFDTPQDAINDSCVPYVDECYGMEFLDQFETPQDLIEWTNSMRGSVAKGVLDEGIVVHVMDASDLSKDEQMTLRNILGEQMQMKSVSAAFLLKKAKRG